MCELAEGGKVSLAATTAAAGLLCVCEFDGAAGASSQQLASLVDY